MFWNPQAFFREILAMLVGAGLISACLAEQDFASIAAGWSRKSTRSLPQARTAAGWRGSVHACAPRWTGAAA